MPLGKKADAGDYIKDFRKSDAPQFKGKSKKKRDKMAVAAYLAKKDEIVDIVRELLQEKAKNESLWANINAKKKRGEKSSHKNSKAYKAAKKAGTSLKKSKMKEIVLDVLYEKSVHDPVKPGILKKRLGTLSCSKVRSAKSKLKNKGTHYAKALQRYLNYHCQ